MQKALFIILFVFVALGAFSQDFFDKDFDQNKRYVILIQPLTGYKPFNT